jgi:hypothetical protein
MIGRVFAIVLVLVAGAIAYRVIAVGDAGPMVAFGHGDAHRAAIDAWQQIPWHLALALGLALARPTGLGPVAGVPTATGLVLLAVWNLFLTTVGLRSLGDYSDQQDVLVSSLLLLLYGAALVASWPLIVPAPRQPAGGHPSTASDRST